MPPKEEGGRGVVEMRTDFIIIACMKSILLLLKIECAVVCWRTNKKKDILNIHIKSEGINIFPPIFGYIEFTIFVVQCQKFTFIAQLFIT